MMNTRQLFRVVGSKFTKLLLEKPSLLASTQVSRDFAPLHHVSQRSANIHTSCKIAGAQNEAASVKQPLGKLERKLHLSFTCKRCGTRNSKVISKLSYEKGIVIVRCDGCRNNHLIADHLGWIITDKAKRNVEQILAAKGESVQRIRNYTEGTIEVVESSEYHQILALNSPDDDNQTVEHLSNNDKLKSES